MSAQHTYAVLLRGVNVGGKNRLAMADLRTLLEALGHEQVVTLLQSGNAVLGAGSGPATVARGIEEAIASELGLAVRVLVRTPAELREIAAGNPFLGREGDLSKLHVVVLEREPPAAALVGLDPQRSPGDAFTVSGGQIYLHYPNGAGRTKFSLDYFERRLGVAGTARNWQTLLKLIALTER
jgi:uncharacterized protein (DUF1697 family)